MDVSSDLLDSNADHIAVERIGGRRRRRRRKRRKWRRRKEEKEEEKSQRDVEG